MNFIENFFVFIIKYVNFMNVMIFIDLQNNLFFSLNLILVLNRSIIFFLHYIFYLVFLRLLILNEVQVCHNFLSDNKNFYIF